eukprot:gnl/TRDRNA2_/TRDRNA2_175066_c18_seq1.p1 gnl/TRDRNA2_/TRDRNA2_175066_c18~~gnl/TRDRNA2_/TRDRNA2_175066_c18_seq1.p1  ORF type:complete len:273 (-),score=29.59 gnl/TRDRNA2_/TRDRNA2_175066_c18_seq1:36-854(-)
MLKSYPETPEVRHALGQLHQWVQWHRELELPLPFSSELRDRCSTAFRLISSSPFQMEHSVAGTMMELGARVEENVAITEGYNIDILAQWEGTQIAIELAGPKHKLTEATSTEPHRRFLLDGVEQLKSRQLRSLGWQVVVVPCWEWDEVKASHARRHQYLSKILRTVNGHGQLLDDRALRSAPDPWKEMSILKIQSPPATNPSGSASAVPAFEDDTEGSLESQKSALQAHGHTSRLLVLRGQKEFLERLIRKAESRDVVAASSAQNLPRRPQL